MQMTAAMREWIGRRVIAQFDSMRDANGHLPPPWKVFPSYPPTSMGWRMGTGETYMAYWQCVLAELSDDARADYRRKHRAPLYWYWIYWNLESPLIAICVMITALLTFIPRIFLHMLYRTMNGSGVTIPAGPPDVG